MSDQPFVPTIAQSLYGAEHGSYDVPDYADSLLHGILSRWETVFWNINQKSWEPHAYVMGSVAYQPYVWDACDCGGKEIQHKPDCRLELEFHEWNERRIESCRPYPNHPDVFKASEVSFAAMAGATPESQAWLEANPRPPCTCGEADGWEERECAETCISQKPNFGIIGDVIQLRWYKHPHRGLSVTVLMTRDNWIDWHDRVMEAIDDAEHAHDIKRGYCMRYPCKRCGKGQ